MEHRGSEVKSSNTSTEKKDEILPVQVQQCDIFHTAHRHARLPPVFHQNSAGTLQIVCPFMAQTDYKFHCKFSL